MDKTTKYAVTINLSDTTLNKKQVSSVIREFDSNDNTIEKISYLNKRLDDILIFGGVIVTLLLAINVGVYIKAESEVDAHFKDNFEAIKTKVQDNLNKIEEASAKAQAELATVVALRRSIQQANPQVADDDEDGRN